MLTTRLSRHPIIGHLGDTGVFPGNHLITILKAKKIKYTKKHTKNKLTLGKKKHEKNPKLNLHQHVTVHL